MYSTPSLVPRPSGTRLQYTLLWCALHVIYLVWLICARHYLHIIMCEFENYNISVIASYHCSNYETNADMHIKGGDKNSVVSCFILKVPGAWWVYTSYY